MKYSLVFCSLFLSILVMAQPSKEEIIKHHIRKIAKTTTMGESVYEQASWYDREGNDSAQSLYGKISVIKNTFNKGRLISVIHVNDDGKEGDKYLYVYGADGSYTVTETDGAFGMKSYEWYNAKKKLTKSQSPDGNTITYKYDAKGNLTHVNSDGQNNAVKIKRQHFYNAQGQLIRTENDEEGFILKTVYTYDAKGRMTKADYGDGTTSYTYNDKGKLINELTMTGTKEELIVRTTTNEYNDKGLLVKRVEKQKYYSEDESVTTITFEYEYF
ncbi:MAG: hypothetical protein WDN26_07550 [Chitinophagaceae bacterium]